MQVFSQGQNHTEEDEKEALFSGSGIWTLTVWVLWDEGKDSRFSDSRRQTGGKPRQASLRRRLRRWRLLLLLFLCLFLPRFGFEDEKEEEEEALSSGSGIWTLTVWVLWDEGRGVACGKHRQDACAPYGRDGARKTGVYGVGLTGVAGFFLAAAVAMGSRARRYCW
jgi:hypothetical protein